MTETSEERRHRELAAALTRRWPEQRVAPSLGRIRALCELLGDPQRAMPVIQVTGTNGKGSTAIMIEALLRSVGLRTGRFSSPHLTDVRERISIDGAPISMERFAAVWDDIAPYVEMVDVQRIDGVEMTFFEVITALAYAAFADAPVDVAVVEVGMGGTWDATSVADATVGVITPISYDHMHLLGDTLAAIAGEKAGIIKTGTQAVIAAQEPEAADVLAQRCVQTGSSVRVEGIDFGVLERTTALGGQVLGLSTAAGPLHDLHLPLHGAHMAHNAALAVAAVEALLGEKPLTPEIIQDGFDQVVAPGRMEVVRTSPTVVLDSAHNPHGATSVVATLEEAFSFHPLIGVFAAMRDKDVREVLEVLEPVMHQVVVTTVASTDRALSPQELAEVATEVFGPQRVHQAPTMAEALEVAIATADDLMALDPALLATDDLDGAPPTPATPGVLVTGTVIGLGEARALLVPGECAAGESGIAARSGDTDARREEEGGAHLEIGSLAFGGMATDPGIPDVGHAPAHRADDGPEDHPEENA